MPVMIFSIKDSEAVEEEDEEMKAKRLQAQAERKEKLAAAQLLATTKIMTPADFAKIEASSWPDKPTKT
ncbi:hypothetical protein BGZ81_004267 [Podila clonocystis]|nr:hypothetical protein BGZ81_004267 [Podila clonocystis]